ncbi:phosphotransferase [Actinoplanes sp. NPDC051343]|uniref:phosphotransferase n=1 Tax=Actinoplanes sp. NPDC051343 TaxID=3363906 RepID=UPI00379B9C08
MITAARTERLGEDRVRALLRLQHPDLAGLPLASVKVGGGSKLWRLGDDLAVRLPHTLDAADRLCRQDRWLPLLAPGLPLAVPEPVRIGAPSVLFRWHWSVVRWVPGETGLSLPTDDKSMDVLAAFLKALHVEAHIEAPGFRIPGVAGGPRVPRWIHGDLGPSNVVQAGGMLAGVVGFGELCGGDPAVDLASLRWWLPSGAGERLLAAYGGGDDLVTRVELWAAALFA